MMMMIMIIIIIIIIIITIFLGTMDPEDDSNTILRNLATATQPLEFQITQTL
jgi:uncharacterized membrane protein